MYWLYTDLYVHKLHSCILQLGVVPLLWSCPQEHTGCGREGPAGVPGDDTQVAGTLRLKAQVTNTLKAQAVCG